MDFEKLLSGCKSNTCVLSVESYADGGYGNIRIVDGNKAHYDDMANTLHHPFVPDSPYAEYFPQNNNFEDYVYRCAIMAQPAHAYVPLMQPSARMFPSFSVPTAQAFPWQAARNSKKQDLPLSVLPAPTLM